MKVFLDTIGCRLNQSEIEAAGLRFRGAGHLLTGSPEDADILVLNTCSVTGQAAADSRARVRQLARRMSSGARLFLTGCWSALEPQAALELPGVTGLVEMADKDRLAEEILGLGREEFIDPAPFRQPLPGERGRTRAFVKAQDGCDHFCAYCVTRLARGKARSLPTGEIRISIEAALRGGAREVVLSGVQLGFWGKDLCPALRLGDLVRELLNIDGLERLRLSSLEPWDLDEELIAQFANPVLCPHLHLPLQSGSRATLTRMARRFFPDQFEKLVSRVRDFVPEIALTTDLIAGFPGETEGEFEETCRFVRSLGLAGGHVFPYSARAGTPAARFKNQVPVRERRDRAAALRSILEESSRAYRINMLGSRQDVLWESGSQNAAGTWLMEGLTANYQRVSAESAANRWNTISTVMVTGLDQSGLIGRLV